MDDDEEYFESEDYGQDQDETEYKITFKDLERIGGPMIGLGTIISEKDIKGNNIKNLFRLIKKKTDILTGEQLLQYYIQIMIIKLKDDEIMNVENSMNILFKYIPNLKNPEYINPLGYILGYMATNEGKSMEKLQVKKTLDYVPRLKNYGFTEPDLIRYSRLWLNLAKS